MNTIIKSIQRKLKIAVPELRWIDQDFGQLELEHPPVNFPCALIDVPQVNWSNSSRLEQQGETTINIRVAFRVYDRSNMHAPTNLSERAEEHFKVLKKINICLHGTEDTEANYSSLCRTQTIRGKSIDPRIYTLAYSTTLFSNREYKETPKPHLKVISKRL